MPTWCLIIDLTTSYSAHMPTDEWSRCMQGVNGVFDVATSTRERCVCAMPVSRLACWGSSQTPFAQPRPMPRASARLVPSLVCIFSRFRPSVNFYGPRFRRVLHNAGSHATPPFSRLSWPPPTAHPQTLAHSVCVDTSQPQIS
ncbi:unnamed protein product [Protopolystoma xenopodis]|uniref:Uncharacterized protein n=1 Tax=Protopolystoma xenopodis TaxID=117903 RepID=A0A3S5BBP2_9PLAT|nr:unnamed protein product [Protopolystoma xenopodis]